jgi:periplasmic copper chaperone A
MKKGWNMRSVVRIVLSSLFTLAVAAPASAADITVTNAWFRALPGGLPAGGYFSLHNTGSAPVDLAGANSSACGMLMLHRSTQSGGMSRMDDVSSVTVPAGGAIEFAPGGYHLMCMYPTAAMTPGKSVTVTLRFTGGGQLDSTFAVRNAAGK